MSSQAPTNPPPTSSLIDQLAPRLKQIGLVLACLFLAYTSIIIYQAYQLYTAKGGSLTTVFWGVGIDVLLIATGLVGWYAASAQPTRRLSEPDQVRILILMVAGGGGLLTALFGVALAFSSPP